MKNLPIRTILFTILVGSIIASAGIAVTAVLTGGFNDTLGRALWTIALAVIHSLLGLGYLTILTNRKTNQLEWSSNTLFASIMVSFIANILSTWNIIAGDHVWNTYQALIVLHFAVFHGEALASLFRRHKLIDILIYVNYAFMAVVVAMLTVVIYADGAHLGELFNRFFAAAAIIDGTLTLVVIILERMFAPKHTQAIAQGATPAAAHTKSNDLILIFIAVTLGIVQLFGGFFWALFPLAL